MFDATDVFAREVLQKSISALPCCMGSIFCVASHAAWGCENWFLQHLSSEKAIFSFVQHLPSENHQNEENRTSKPCCGDVSAEVATSKIGSKSTSCPGIYDRDTFFNLTKKLTNRFNNVCNPPGISMITTSGRLANFIQFHNKSSQNLKNLGMGETENSS